MNGFEPLRRRITDYTAAGQWQEVYDGPIEECEEYRLKAENAKLRELVSGYADSFERSAAMTIRAAITDMVVLSARRARRSSTDVGRITSSVARSASGRTRSTSGKRTQTNRVGA